MMLAESTSTIIQIDGGALIGAAGTLAGGIVTAVTVVARMWFTYQRERDQQAVKQTAELADKMDSWQERALGREEIIRNDNKANSEALLNVARETVKVETALIMKVDELMKAKGIKETR